MDAELKRGLESKLQAGFEERGLADGLAAYRTVLRELRARNPDAFRRAADHYEETVLPRLAADGDPVDTWIEYGRVIGELTAPGRMMVVDPTGRSFSYRATLEVGAMVLFVPDSGRQGTFVAVTPRERSAAQEATVGLLVEGRLGL